MAQKFKKIHVIKRDNDFFVLPPLIELTGNEDVKLFNHTDEDLLWKVDHATAFTTSPILETVAAGQNSTVRRTVNTANILIVTSYQVVMLTSGKKAKGNSDPMIIIDN